VGAKTADVVEQTPRISIALCTYRRPALLRRLVSELETQQTQGLFTYDIVIVDNDADGSARATVGELARASALAISYDIEPEQNIALARNRAVANAGGDLIAFIDDDESACPDWLLRLYSTLREYRVDGVLGPVKPRFAVSPPKWVVKGRIFERPECGPTGARLHWTNTRTGNVLIRRAVFDAVEGPFRQEFGSGGEDRDFFRRATEAGFVFVACEEAAVDEIVPAERMRVSFQLRRALLRGKASIAHDSDVQPLSVVKSVIACVGYTACLPFFLLAGHHVFVSYLIRNFDHLGKLLALCGVDVVKEKYLVQ
jgi:glycosyltransferase involved in cell wall biosynthesis